MRFHHPCRGPPALAAVGPAHQVKAGRVKEAACITSPRHTADLPTSSSGAPTGSERLFPFAFLCWPGLIPQGPQKRGHGTLRYFKSQVNFAFGLQSGFTISISCQYLKLRQTVHPKSGCLTLKSPISSQWVHISCQPELRSNRPLQMDVGALRPQVATTRILTTRPTQKTSNIASTAPGRWRIRPETGAPILFS